MLFPQRDSGRQTSRWYDMHKLRKHYVGVCAMANNHCHPDHDNREIKVTPIHTSRLAVCSNNGREISMAGYGDSISHRGTRRRLEAPYYLFSRQEALTISDLMTLMQQSMSHRVTSELRYQHTNREMHPPGGVSTC